MRDFLAEPREGIVWEFRRRKKKNARVSWSRMESQKYSQPFPGFDVVDSLLQMWGMYAHARRTADKPDESRPRLFDEPPAASATG
jgi:hypothetical protein